MNLKILVPISLIGLAVSCSSRRDGAQAPEAVIPVKVGNVRRIHTTQTVPVGGCVLSWKNASNGAFVVSGKVVEEGIHSAKLAASSGVCRCNSAKQCPTVRRVWIGVTELLFLPKDRNARPLHARPLHFGLKRRCGFQRIDYHPNTLSRYSISSRQWRQVLESVWWAVAGSNRGPPACKAGALTG